MNVLVSINCHRRELRQRLGAVRTLSALRPDDHFLVLTSAHIDSEAAQFAEEIGTRLISTSDVALTGLRTRKSVEEEATAGLDRDFEARLWRTFLSDRHIFDLADIGGYATRAFSAADLRAAFMAARVSIMLAFAAQRIDLVLPGTPDNYLSAMCVEWAKHTGIPVVFWGGSELCGPGRHVVYDSLSLGNSRLSSCRDQWSCVEADGDLPMGANDALAHRPATIATLLAQNLDDLPLSVGLGHKRTFRAYIQAASSGARSLIGSARDTRAHQSPIELLLTTTEGTGKEALARTVSWAGRRARNMRDLHTLAKPPFGSLDEACRTVLVPLHFQPEAYVTFAMPELANQVTWVRLLSLALPPDVNIVVKEHPAQDPGWRPIGFYRQISSLPRVTLCDPRAASGDLLKRGKVDMVCTLGGSIAVEARAAGTRVVSVVDSVSASFPGVVRLDPLSADFSESLTRVVDEPPPLLSRRAVDAWYQCLDTCVVPSGSYGSMSASLIDWLLAQ